MPPHRTSLRFFSARLSEGRRLLRLVFHDSRVAGRDTQFVETKAGCAATDTISIDTAMRPATTTAALSSMIERIACSVDRW